MDKVTSPEFDARGLADWRVLLGAIEATFVTESYDRTTSFVGQIAAAAESAGHTVDVDARYPDRVHVTLATQGITEADVALASTISDLAAAQGIASDPGAPSRLEIAIDAIDIDAVRPFWKAVLGYVDEPPSKEGGQVVALVDPLRIGAAVWFQQMDAPRLQRNRIHIDVTVPHDTADERIAAAIDAGGTLLSDAAARAFWVLADPEGNEACVCTWQDRG